MQSDLSTSDVFYKRLAEIVEANLENEQFGVEDLAREIGLSRSQIHRKLHDATGKSISHFVREIRLQRAHEMLVDEIGTASEIAYKVGFGSPTYFSKCFVEHFGYTPGEAKQKAAAGIPPVRTSDKHVSARSRRVYLIIAGATMLLVLGWFIYNTWNGDRSPNNLQSTKSIAVLYFDNISGDASQDYLSDGVTDEIISRLSMIRGLRVPGLSYVKPFKVSSVPLSEIADQLNVNVVLEGNIKKSGDKLRITARLIDIPGNATLWTEVYERSYQTAEIFEIQSSIAKAVATRFQFATTPQLESSTPPTKSIDAYDLFLQASFHPETFGVGMPVSWHHQAEAQLKKAIRIDPDFAQSYLELAKLYNYQYLASAEGEDKKDSIELLVNIALEKDPNLVEGYVHLASISSTRNKSLGFLSIHTLNNDSTLMWLKKAYEIDPIQGLMGYASLYFASGNFPAAVHCYNQVLKFSPWHTDALLGKASLFGYMDVPDSSLYYLSIVEKLDPTNPNLFDRKILEISLMMHRFVLKQDLTEFLKTVERQYGNDRDAVGYRMGVALLFARKFKEAEKFYRMSQYRDMDFGLLMMQTGRPDSGGSY